MKDFINSVGDWFVNNWRPIAKVAAIVILGIIVVKIVLAIIKRQLGKTKLDKTVQSFICSILKFVLYLILIFSIIASLGVSITGLTVVISAVSLAISLALQDSLKNLVNGFIIISTKLLKQGDWVQIGSAEGSVVDVRMLYTILKTADNKKISIPNSTVLSNNIVNFNTLRYRRLDIPFSLSYTTDVDFAKKVMHEVIASCEMVYDDPAPMVILSELGTSSITLNVRVWCSSDDYWNTKWYLIDNIFNELKRNKLKIPFSQLEVALVESNQEQYVREAHIEAAVEHKKKPGKSDDIISSINKKFQNASKKLKKKEKHKEEVVDNATTQTESSTEGK